MLNSDYINDRVYFVLAERADDLWKVCVRETLPSGTILVKAQFCVDGNQSVQAAKRAALVKLTGEEAVDALVPDAEGNTWRTAH